MDIKQYNKLINRKTNLLFLALDMAETLVADLEDLHINIDSYRFDIKRKIKNMKRDLRSLVQIIPDVYGEDNDAQTSFGETSDIILEKIINELYPNDNEDI